MGDLFDIGGRHVLVTGASKGLGAHFASMLAERGAKVTLAARRRNALQEVMDGVRGGTVQSVVMDVTDVDSIAEAFDDAESTFGPVTVLVNNAGMARTRPALQTEAGDFDAVVDTNLRGAWQVARECASRLVKKELPGSIVNIASILAFRVAGSVMPYAVSKAALVQMTRALALEWARYGIRVNALAPGYVKTGINADFMASEAGKALVKRIPQRRIGDANELDGALLLLISDAGSYMTGSAVTVDGGHLVSSL